MNPRIALSLMTAALLAACTTPQFTPSSTVGPDFTRSSWGGQSLVPPRGLYVARQGELIGRSIDTPAGRSRMTIEASLVDPSDRMVDYVLARRTGSQDYTVVPISALSERSGGTLFVNASDNTIASLPQVTTAELNTAFVPAPASSSSNIPRVSSRSRGRAADMASADGSTRTQLVRRGSVVGYRVVDGSGSTVGTVSSVAAEPGTGEVRYLIVASPTLGSDNYIAVPAASARVDRRRVVVGGRSTAWMQTPRYSNDELVEAFGPMSTMR